MGDIRGLYPYEMVWYANRAQYITDEKGKTTKLGSWEDFDFSICLDNIDVVVLEATEPTLQNYAYGLVDCLIDFLDTYEPQKSSRNYVENLNCASKEAWEINPFNGVWTKGEKHSNNAPFPAYRRPASAQSGQTHIFRYARPQWIPEILQFHGNQAPLPFLSWKRNHQARNQAQGQSPG